MPPAYIVETSRELDALPADIRERVKRDKKKGRGLQWSGKTLGEMAAAIRIRGHKGFYAMQLRSVHALSAREDVLRVEGPEGVTFWRNDLDLAQVKLSVAGSWPAPGPGLRILVSVKNDEVR